MLLNKKISLTNSIKFYFTKDLLEGIINFHKISYRKGFLRILIIISSMKFLFTNLHLIRSSINIIISSIQFAGEKGILGSIMVKTGYTRKGTSSNWKRQFLMSKSYKLNPSLTQKKDAPSLCSCCNKHKGSAKAWIHIKNISKNLELNCLCHSDVSLLHLRAGRLVCTNTSAICTKSAH